MLMIHAYSYTSGTNYNYSATHAWVCGNHVLCAVIDITEAQWKLRHTEQPI